MISSSNIHLALIAGLLAGLSGAVTAQIGHEEGVSGAVAALLRRTRANLEPRLGFLAGLIVAGATFAALQPERFGNTTDRPLLAFLLGGILVGVGARLANGCTSGHGLLGVSRGAKRSMAALSLFGIAAIVTVGLYPVAVGGVVR